MITATLDAGDYKSKSAAFKAAVPGAMDVTAMEVGDEIMRLSQSEVPLDEGTLKDSGTVQRYQSDVVVGYHTAYAARLHEHPEYRFKNGRKGKYLEDPIRRNQDILGLKFTTKLQKELPSG